MVKVQCVGRGWLAPLVVLVVLVVQAAPEWCVPGCACVQEEEGGIRRADCSNMRLLNVDSELLGGELFVQALDLSHNSLSELCDDFPGGTRGRWRLVALSLAGNAISSVSQHALRGLVALRALDLADNRLSALPRGVLQDAKALRALDLAGNKLKPDPGGDGWLLDAPQLTHLSLARCNLGHLSATALSRLPSLRTLDLSGNQLVELDAQRVLGALPALQRLELAGNPLRCDPAVTVWLAERHIEQAEPVCRPKNAGPERSQAMRVESSLPAVFAGLMCAQVAESDTEPETLETDDKDDIWHEERDAALPSARPDVTGSLRRHAELDGWSDLWGMPAIWAAALGFLSGIMLCVWLVWCWFRCCGCCRRCCCRGERARRAGSRATLLMAESSNSLLFEETPTLMQQPPGTPPPPYRSY